MVQHPVPTPNIRAFLNQIALSRGLLIWICLFLYSCTSNKAGESVENNVKIKDKDQKDANFIYEVAEGNLKEIELGKMGQTSGGIPEVKELGARMEREHTKTFSELQLLAKNKGINLPTNLPEEGQNSLKELENLTGNEFDVKYCQLLVNDHKKTIEKFEDFIYATEDTELRSWATTTLPIVRSHLSSALECQKICENKEIQPKS